MSSDLLTGFLYPFYSDYRLFTCILIPLLVRDNRSGCVAVFRVEFCGFRYNAAFDLSFLENSAKKYGLEFPEIHVKDILAIAKSRIKGLENYRLETVSSYLGMENRQCHRALDDCRMLYEIYNKLNKI